MSNNEELIETLDGSFRKIIYRSSTYMVSIFHTHDGSITVTGPSFDIDLNSKYTLVGKYVDHPKYGFQFEMMSVSKYLPSAKDEVIKYLSSPLFKGIGKKAAEKIYAVYGDETLLILKNDLSLIDGINLTDIQKKALIEGFSTLNDEDSEGIFELINIGYSSKEANLILRHFKEDIFEVIKTNPYKIYLEVYGIPFNKVVESSKKIEIDEKEIKFKIAYLVYIFKQISFMLGDTFLYESEFRNEYDKNYSDFDEIIKKCVEEKYLSLEEDRYYLSQDLKDEYYIANALLTHFDDDLFIDDVNLEVAIDDNAANNSIIYDEDQIEAIKSFFKNNISMVVGGPGTGKTTIIKSIVEIFNDYFPYNSIMVIAPTGRAAKRINEICNIPSKTIHSLLRWDKETNTFTFDESNPIEYDAIIVDESSMVDNGLFAALLRASINVKKICMIGDDNQLPSIRQGNVLADLINSKEFKLTRLSNIHRQKAGNEIISLAYDIVDNNVNIDAYNQDVNFIDISTISKKDLVNYINQDLNDGSNLDSIQVLSPMYRGEFGIDALNLTLQASFNPPNKDKIDKRIANCLYRENDKILQLKNRPDDDVYNGDIGILEDIDLNDNCFLINYKGIYIYYNFDELIDISLAYAMSVHKAQGSEYDVVYFICSKEHQHMLYKKLIYTAISRAKTKLVIIGDKDTFYKAIAKKERERKTSLIAKIKDFNEGDNYD